MCGMSFNAYHSLANISSHSKKISRATEEGNLWTKSNSFLYLLSASLRSIPPAALAPYFAFLLHAHLPSKPFSH